VAESSTPPFTLLWTNATPGVFTFRAEARDDAGWKVESSPIKVTFIYPPPLIDVEASHRAPDGSFVVRLLGVQGQVFRLETSANLSGWSPLVTDSFLDEAFDFEDTLARTASVRFYRAVPLP